MKFLLCMAAILLTGTAAFQQRQAASTVSNNLLINPEILKQMDQIKYIADNFESWSPRKQLDNINDICDMIITEVRAFLQTNGFDPMELPSVDESVNLVGTTIQVKLSNGLISNASSIFRDGDVLLTYEDRLLTVEIPTFIKVLQLVYDYEFNVGDGTILDGKVNGEVILVDIKCVVEIDFRELHISLKSFEIPTIGAINVKFEGGMLEWLVEAITDFITGKFKDQVVQVVEAVCGLVLTTIFNIINKILESLAP